MTTYEFLTHPDGYTFIEDDGKTTPAGDALIKEIQGYSEVCRGDFSALHGQMDAYEDFWRVTARRLAFTEDKELNRHLPAYAINDGRVLADRLVRANVRRPIRYRVPIGSEWSEDERTASQRFERYCAAVHAMADQERRAQRPRPLGSLQATLAWMLSVRGMGILIPFVRSSPRQKIADTGWGTDDSPFVMRTPDPRLCMFSDDFFVHQHWRNASEFLMQDWHGYLRPKDEKTGQCQAWNAWWQDCEGHVWNATIIDNCFLIPPTDHTATRGLTSLPVIVDSAFGAPVETTISSETSASVKHHYQGALEAVAEVYAAKNLIKSFELTLLRSSTFANLLVFSDKNVTKDDADALFSGRSIMKLNKGDDAKLLEPPQLSESIKMFQMELDREGELGGMPNSSGSGVPDGMSGIASQEYFFQGDAKAGPISDAMKRMFLDMQQVVGDQHRRLRRTIQMMNPGDTKKRPFMEAFKPEDLPAPGTYELRIVHEPFLVEDEYRKAQTVQVYRAAGRPFISSFDEISDDPIREDELRQEEQMKALPVISYFESAKIAQKIGRPDIAKIFLTMAKMEAGALEAQAAQVPGKTNAPVAAVQPDAAPLPQGQPALLPASAETLNPADPADSAALGAMGAQMGGAM